MSSNVDTGTNKSGTCNICLKVFPRKSDIADHKNETHDIYSTAWSLMPNKMKRKTVGQLTRAFSTEARELNQLKRRIVAAERALAEIDPGVFPTGAHLLDTARFYAEEDEVRVFGTGLAKPEPQRFTKKEVAQRLVDLRWAARSIGKTTLKGQATYEEVADWLEVSLEQRRQGMDVQGINAGL